MTVSPLVSGVDIWSNYDRAIVDWLGSIKTLTNPTEGAHSAKSILRVFATPERAFAQAKERLAKRNPNAPKTRVHPLPLISIDQIGIEVDLSRYRRHDSMWVDDEIYDDTPEVMEWPQAVNLQYNIDFWTRNKSELDDYIVQFMLFFRGIEIFVEVAHRLPLGVQIVPIILNGITNASDLESGDPNQRTLRRVADITVKGWLVRPTTVLTAPDTLRVNIWDSPNLPDPEPSDLIDARDFPLDE